MGVVLRVPAVASRVEFPAGWVIDFPPTDVSVYVTDTEFAELFTADDGPGHAPKQGGNGAPTAERVPGAMWGPGRESEPSDGNAGGTE